jgi:hypothetical protein
MPRLKGIQTHLRLGFEYLKQNDLASSVQHDQAALELARLEGDPNLIHRALELLAESQFKKGELENCVALHKATSCIVPFAPEAIHQRPEGAIAAMKTFEELLALWPDDLRARWLLNIAAMAAGRYPADVPENQRIPSEIFTSKEDIGHFANVAQRVGIGRRNLAGGVIIEDFDNDGLLDVVLSSMGPFDPMSYYRNNGDGTFSDLSVQSGLARQLGGLNCIQTDYDNDGLPDIFVTRGGWMGADGVVRPSLLHNKGGGVFEDVTVKAGLAINPGPTQTAAWADFDGDGLLDVYVGHEAIGKTMLAAQLLHNNGDGTFTDIAAKAHVENMRFAKGVIAGDYDNDGRPDIYVSNWGQPNRLYHNEGDGTFVDVAVEQKVTEPIMSFSTFFFDYDNDGWLDLYVGSFPGAYGMDAGGDAFGSEIDHAAADELRLPNDGERARLYHNDHGHFVDVTKEMNVWRVDLTMGSGFGDLDNDGWPDFFLGTGFPLADSLTPKRMMHNVEGRRFSDVTASGGFGHLQKGHGIAFADLNNDGRQEVFLQVGGAYAADAFPDALFVGPPNDNHWVTLKLVGTKSNRAAIGARIQVHVGARSVFAAVSSGGSFGATSFQRSIGLGTAKQIESIDVQWPSGLQQVFRGVPVDSFVLLKEGQPKVVVQKRRKFAL